MNRETVSQYFYLPVDRDGSLNNRPLSILFRAIPLSWEYMNGRLYAPYQLVKKHPASGGPRIAAKTQLYCSGGSAPQYLGVAFEEDSDEFIRDSNPLWRRAEPGVYHPSVDNPLLPRLLWFSYAGQHYPGCSSVHSFEDAIELAGKYAVNFEYNGCLEFIARTGDSTCQIAARVGFKFKANFGDDSCANPRPFVQVSYSPQHGGTQADIETVLAACRNLELQSFQPEPDPQATLAI